MSIFFVQVVPWLIVPMSSIKQIKILTIENYVEFSLVVVIDGMEEPVTLSYHDTLLSAQNALNVIQNKLAEYPEVTMISLQ